MTNIAYLRVRNWDKWQSYRNDRGQPPWIKVYRALLTDYEFATLTDAEKGQLLCIWMLAAERNGRIPYDANAIKRFCSLEQEPDLEKLISLQFLETEGKRRRPRGAKISEVGCHGDAPEKSREEKRREDPPLPPQGGLRPKVPSWLSEEAWSSWVQHRKELGKTLKPSTVEAQWRKLDTLRKEGHAPEDVIEHSIAGGWQGLFPPDKKNGKRVNGSINWWEVSDQTVLEAAQEMGVSTRGKDKRELFPKMSEAYRGVSDETRARVDALVGR